MWSLSCPQGRVKDEVMRDPDPAQDKRQIQFRARGGAPSRCLCAVNTGGAGERAAGLPVVGKLQEIFVCQEADQLHEYFIREQTCSPGTSGGVSRELGQRRKQAL